MKEENKEKSSSGVGSGYPIRGYKVVFPNKPYPSQFMLMNKVLEGIINKQNCLVKKKKFIPFFK